MSLTKKVMVGATIAAALTLNGGTMTNQDQPAGRRPSKLAAALQNAVTRVHSMLLSKQQWSNWGKDRNSRYCCSPPKDDGVASNVRCRCIFDGWTQRGAGGFQWRRVRHPLGGSICKPRLKPGYKIKGIRRRVKVEQSFCDGEATPLAPPDSDSGYKRIK